MIEKIVQNQLLNIDKLLREGKIELAIKIIITDLTIKSALKNKLKIEKSVLLASPTA